MDPIGAWMAVGYSTGFNTGNGQNSYGQGGTVAIGSGIGGYNARVNAVGIRFPAAAPNAMLAALQTDDAYSQSFSGTVSLKGNDQYTFSFLANESCDVQGNDPQDSDWGAPQWENTSSHGTATGTDRIKVRYSEKGDESAFYDYGNGSWSSNLGYYTTWGIDDSTTTYTKKWKLSNDGTSWMLDDGSTATVDSHETINDNFHRENETVTLYSKYLNGIDGIDRSKQQ
jgi:hypothetical protein